MAHCCLYGTSRVQGLPVFEGVGKAKSRDFAAWHDEYVAPNIRDCGLRAPNKLKAAGEREIWLGISLRFATYHLGEAVGELSSLLQSYLEPLHDPNSGKGKMVHALQHLNWYWNAATDLEENYDSFAEESFLKFSRFPPAIVSTFTQGATPNAFLIDLWPSVGESFVVDSNSNSTSDILSMIRLITDELLVHSSSDGRGLVRSDETKTMLRMYCYAFRYWSSEFGSDSIAKGETIPGKEIGQLIPLELRKSVPVVVLVGGQK